jgi:glycosyltransferase involved in cell wall biosynthesis
LLDQEDAVTFMAWAPHPRLDAMRERLPRLDLRFVSDRSRPFGETRARAYGEMLRAVNRAVSLAATKRYDVLHHLYLEKSEMQMLLTTGIRRRPPGLFGTFFWPYFVHDADSPSTVVRAVHATNRLALRRLLSGRMLDALFVHSPSIRTRLLAALGDRISDDRIVVIPDPAVAPSGSRKAARNWLGVSEAVPMFLFLGRLSERKGADLLLQALPLLEEAAGGDWRVVIAGQPEAVGEPDVERCRAVLRRPERLIARLGFAPDEDVDRYFLAADAVLLPYRGTHLGTSGIVQRAAAAGRVVIATDVGDIGSTVREHDLGLVVEPEDHRALVGALRTFVDDHQSLTQRIGPKAIAYAEGASWRIAGERVRARYLSTASGGPPST